MTRFWPLLMISAFLAVGAAVPKSLYAQSPADNFAREQSARAEAERLKALKKMTPGMGAKAVGQPQPPRPAAGGKCFDITRAEVEGVAKISMSEIEKVIGRYRNKCVGIAEINVILRDLTNLYLDRGYVTSRVYVPQQDIAKTKLLRLMVVEGVLADIYLNSKKTPRNGSLATAFPGVVGQVANIRDIEQGLDQINRLSSNAAKTAMLPGEMPGTSILNVENHPTGRWHGSLGNSNLGQKDTGYSKSSLSLGADDLLGLNDQLGFSYEHTGPDYPWRGDGRGFSNSYSGNASIPYGYSTVSINGSLYRYKSSVPGNFGPIHTSGNSSQLGAEVDRVVARDKDSITTMRGGLTYKETENFLLGNRIDVGSRNYTVGEVGISHSRRMLGGIWAFDASFDKGLGLFDAVDAGDPGAGNADPRFSKFTGTVSATKPIELGDRKFELNVLLTGQYSPDNLLGSEQISLGNYSNLRGTRDSFLFGNSGFFTHNEFAWRTLPWANNAALVKYLGEFRPYVGLDYGHVVSDGRSNAGGGQAVSWTAGARLVGGRVRLDFGYSDILASSIDVGDAGLFYASTSVRW
jgi:hemolysin activation/secretion protein